MKQLTTEQAIRIFNTCKWLRWSHKRRALLQLRQERLFMPLIEFHASVRDAAGVDELPDTALRYRDHWIRVIETRP